MLVAGCDNCDGPGFWSDDSDLEIEPGFEADYNASRDSGFDDAAAGSFAAANEAMRKDMNANATAQALDLL